MAKAEPTRSTITRVPAIWRLVAYSQGREHHYGLGYPQLPSEELIKTRLGKFLYSPEAGADYQAGRT